MSKLRKKRRNLRTYNLADENGKVLGQITFDPKDEGIVKRFDIVTRRLDDLIEEIKDKTEEEHSKEIDAFMYENMDYLLNSKISEVVFSILKPSVVLESGQFFSGFLVNMKIIPAKIAEGMIERNAG